jgi:hypothetical protein
MVIIASTFIIIGVTVWSLFLGVMTISNAAVPALSKKGKRKELKKETRTNAQQQNVNKPKEASLTKAKIDLRQFQERQMYRWNIAQERRGIVEEGVSNGSSWLAAHVKSK